jgi:hypothetical protein
MVAGGKPSVPVVMLKNTGDTGRCNNIKILFKAPGADTIKISIREDSAGNPGRWYTHRSDMRATDADYKGLKEYIDYDLQVEAINKYGKTLSPILTRKKCH